MSRKLRVLLLIEFSTEVGRRLLRGIAAYTAIQQPWEFYLELPLPKDLPGPRVSSWRTAKSNVDGVIIRDLEFIAEIEAMGVPVIVASTFKEDDHQYPVVRSDSASVGRMGAEHFLERGFQHFAYCGRDDMPWSQVRARSFAARLIEAGHQIHLYRQPRARLSRTWPREQPVLVRWLHELPKPVGLLACSDCRAHQVLQACRSAGIAVPGDVAILGVDNDELICNMSSPPLSSIAVDFETAGYEAAKLLDEMMRGKVPETREIIAVPTHVVTRQSTDILAVPDKEVAHALQFIRRHNGTRIQVPDVVRATNLSHRSLLDRFRRTLGCSIHQEITRVHIRKICQLLINTDLPISRIAASLGYTSTDHFARYFKSRQGLTPLAYRRKHRHI